jgi:uncharacterized Zn-finger protein
MNQQANKKKTYQVTQADFPLSCPTKSMQTWNSHPKVYLELDSSGKAICQYCGAVYILESK